MLKLHIARLLTIIFSSSSFIIVLLFYVYQRNPFPDITISRYYEFVRSVRIKTTEHLAERDYFSFTSHQPLLPLG